MPGDIWIPETARKPKPKVSRCLICGARFSAEQRSQFERHVLACNRKHPDHGEDLIAQRDDNAFTGIEDIERYRYIRRRAAEGTLKRKEWINPDE